MIRKKQVKILLLASVVLFVVGLAAGVFSFTQMSTSSSPNNTSDNSAQTDSPISQPAPVPDELFTGEVVAVANAFSVKVPNGWTASVSTDPNYSAILFARQNELTTLVYNPAIPANITQGGFPLQNGLTEHFFIIVPTPAQQFSKQSHLEVTSESFTFADGFVGEKHFVVKHATEAQNWGGLQKDTEWQGRTYVYQAPSARIEAHLALYPSSAIDIAFYENVVRSISPLNTP